MLAQIGNILVGVWLMAAPAVLGYGDPAATNDRIWGPIAATAAFIAASGVMRPLRWINLPIGAWLVLAPSILGYGRVPLANSLVSGLLLMAFSAVRGRIRKQYGGGWRSVAKPPKPGNFVTKTFVAGLSLAVIASACAGEPRRLRPPVPTSTPTPTPTPGRRPAGIECASPQGAYRVTYPQDWHVNDPETGSACAWFHPQPFEVPQDSEATNIAISIRVERVDYERIAEGSAAGPHVEEVVARSAETVAGRRALRTEIVHSGEALYPPGTRETTWVVDWERRTLVASTTSIAGGAYSKNKQVLARMMSSLERYEPEAACSAAALDPSVPDEPGLPAPVADTRREIVRAAVACDFDKLAELAKRWDGSFTYSFGGGDDPAGFWRRQETDERKPDPLLYLAGVLKRSHATRRAGDTTHYLWPSAFSYDRWEQVPEDKRRELEPLYGPADFAGFAQFGGYTGYRVGIDESGDWLYFVAGD